MEKMEKRNTDLWFTEFQTQNMQLGLKINNILRNVQTRYQHLLVAETIEYGRLLALDGAIQLTEKDEFCYHEMMAHIPISAHSLPERVLIVGGGDGGILRECLKHDFIKEVTLVDIDQEVINSSREFFPSISCAMDDPRARILTMDALEFIKENQNCFDVVIVDSTDPVDFAAGLFQSPFYGDVFNSLTSKGIVIAQTESPFAEPALLKQAVSEMKTAFKQVAVCLGYMPTYPTGMWSYTVGSKFNDPARIVNRPCNIKTKYYTAEIHKASFVLPPFVREIVEMEGDR